MTVLHVVSLPHVQTSDVYCGDAYASNVTKFCRMMSARGHKVVLYGGEHNDAPVAENVVIVTDEEQRRWYGEYNPADLPTIDWDPTIEPWRVMNARAAASIRQRAAATDIICLIGGWSQHRIADDFPNHLVVEFAVGYQGVLDGHRCWPSYAWQHWVHGRRDEGDGQFFDEVIPHFFDPAEFPAGSGDGDFLFLGRMVARKGVQVAVDATNRAGVPLVMAGAGCLLQADGVFTSGEVTVEGDHLSHVGPVGIAERARLMGAAPALFVPTLYFEPFGMVAVEAMLTGTPVISTDWGAFPEIVEDGVTGFRCRTVAEFAQATVDVKALDRGLIRERAQRFTFDQIAPRYERWFDRLLTLWGDGWYA